MRPEYGRLRFLHTGRTLRQCRPIRCTESPEPPLCQRKGNTSPPQSEWCTQPEAPVRQVQLSAVHDHSRQQHRANQIADINPAQGFSASRSRPPFSPEQKIVIRQFPVNSSAPVNSTMTSPKGNKNPHTTRATDKFSRAWLDVLDTTAPIPMRIPARIASSRIRPAGDRALFISDLTIRIEKLRWGQHRILPPFHLIGLCCSAQAQCMACLTNHVQ